MGSIVVKDQHGKAKTGTLVTGILSFFLVAGALGIDIALWVVIYNTSTSNFLLTIDGGEVWTSLGIAFWLTLVAFLALFVAAFPWQEFGR